MSVAEDLAQDALVAALEQCPQSGIPDNPGAWLMATAKRRGIDALRRRITLERKQELIAREPQILQQLDQPDLAALMPREPEVHGLLALMELQARPRGTGRHADPARRPRPCALGPPTRPARPDRPSACRGPQPPRARRGGCAARVPPAAEPARTCSPASTGPTRRTRSCCAPPSRATTTASATSCSRAPRLCWPDDARTQPDGPRCALTPPAACAKPRGRTPARAR